MLDTENPEHYTWGVRTAVQIPDGQTLLLSGRPAAAPDAEANGDPAGELLILVSAKLLDPGDGDGP